MSEPDEKAGTERGPNMTAAEIRVLSPHAVLHALAEAGLAPETAEYDVASGIWDMWDTEEEDWVPWSPYRLITQAWLYVEQFGLTIQPSRVPHRGAWWVGVPTENGVFAPTFATIPLAICRAALLVLEAGR